MIYFAAALPPSGSVSATKPVVVFVSDILVTDSVVSLVVVDVSLFVC